MRTDDRIPYVYFAQVRGGGPIKIGYSVGPINRIKQLQSWCPFPLDFVAMVVGGTTAERYLHELQQQFCIHCEWFEPNEALSQIMAIAAKRGRLPYSIEKEIARREDEWAAKDAISRKQSQVGYDLVMQGKVTPKDTSNKPRSEETKRAFREKRAASDARRRAAKGHGRRYEFAVVATPLNTSDEEANQ